ncbi:MAG: neutral/alkaline non-lysosomal ceramidase N-terminal domain-containing protein [Erysipelotrichaceae bacterium]|nr:neutral/alkaline non-lysosomal ceramidase N-terminal domain-containing protein [Erysipelotrichaceae bacterium]MDY5251618.1 neutral/alkaline non-lysosomal ceramidase N-terminal domain-containing protein [Erysipelotrichaceae bacterium]
MNIGFAKEKIDLYKCNDKNIYLAGFAQKREATGKYDDIFVKCIALKFEDKIYLFFNYDLCAVDELIINKLLDNLAEIKIDKNNVFITSTHTHSSYAGVVNTDDGFLAVAKEIFGKTDAKLIDYICKVSFDCANKAIKDIQPAKVKYNNGICKSFGSNRNNKNLAGNDRLFIVEIEQKIKKIAIINFACHPTILNYTNTKISGDFPGYLEKIFNDNNFEFCMFLNGSCGDISTRFTKQGNGYDEVIRMTKKLYDSSIVALENAKEANLKTMKINNVNCYLKAKTKPTIEDAEKFLKLCEREYDQGIKNGICGSELRLLENHIEGAQANVRYAISTYNPTEIEVNIKILNINDQYFVFIPGECFSELGNIIENSKRHIISYANGYKMYFADSKAYDDQVYEAMSSPFEKGECEKMISKIDEMIKCMEDKK